MQNLGVGWMAKIMWAFVRDHPEDPGLWHYIDEKERNTFRGAGGLPKLFESPDAAEEWVMYQPHDSEARVAELHTPVAVIVAETDAGMVIAPLPGAFVVEKE